MLAGNTTREVESDTVAEQELKTVKRDFGGLNEVIWFHAKICKLVQMCAKMDQLEQLNQLDRALAALFVYQMSTRVSVPVARGGNAVV
ncbi:pentatricopeptide repeat-containing protein [Dorcoceras hygrometricum]|uniref:Pentatricopeptide repeat-containing protein n=1 Tax=Dorcoceras hygrometricum TaxID=472368 RepID=A0A2Z7B906_9LAMI|nr:pentatricopeptide repeat-containing protein [Dorcoceras hygrometricum]